MTGVQTCALPIFGPISGSILNTFLILDPFRIHFWFWTLFRSISASISDPFWIHFRFWAHFGSTSGPILDPFLILDPFRTHFYILDPLWIHFRIHFWIHFGPITDSGPVSGPISDPGPIFGSIYSLGNTSYTEFLGQCLLKGVPKCILLTQKS